MRILVTGGAGFIGSNFIQFMLSAHPDDKLVNIDLLTYAGNLENLSSIERNPAYAFEKGDICDQNFVEKILSKHNINTIVNFAAESHVDRSILGSSEFIRTNIVGTSILLDLAKKHNIERFLQVSTDEVYGSLGSEGFFTESSPLRPNSPYSASKTSADLLALAYFHTHGTPILITRCSNNYGKYQFPEKLIPLMIINALNDKPLPVYGDGMNIRDWLCVDDHCRAIDLVLKNGKFGEVYNVGGNNEYPNIEIVKTILSYLGKSESLIKYVKDRPGHDRRYAIDSSKIRNELGWSPSITFEKGIADTIEWYIQNKSWWERIINKEYQQYYERQYANR